MSLPFRENEEQELAFYEEEDSTSYAIRLYIRKAWTSGTKVSHVTLLMYA